MQYSECRNLRIFRFLCGPICKYKHYFWPIVPWKIINLKNEDNKDEPPLNNATKCNGFGRERIKTISNILNISFRLLHIKCACNFRSTVLSSHLHRLSHFLLFTHVSDRHWLPRTEILLIQSTMKGLFGPTTTRPGGGRTFLSPQSLQLQHSIWVPRYTSVL